MSPPGAGSLSGSRIVEQQHHDRHREPLLVARRDRRVDPDAALVDGFDRGNDPAAALELVAQRRAARDRGSTELVHGTQGPVRIAESECAGFLAARGDVQAQAAVALLVGSEPAARKLGIEPLGRLTGYAYAGCDPKRMGLGPVHAIARCGRSPDEADVIEINEAFAAQVLAVLAALKNPGKCGLALPPVEIPHEKLNRRGGSIALGHPVGASGARLVLTALHQLRETGGKSSLATLCVGGGQGAALWLERP